MSIKKLVEVLPPPQHPIENELTMGWQEVETQVGTLLPEDYKAFITTYGSGKIGGFIYIWNPFSPISYRNLIKSTENFLNYLRKSILNLEEDLNMQLIPYPIFPEPGGILPFGSTIDGDILYWLIQGDPNEWTIVVDEVRSEKYEEHAMSFTEFLTGLLKNELHETIFSESSFDPIAGFVPYPLDY